jgi:hypothetical protein
MEMLLVVVRCLVEVFALEIFRCALLTEVHELVPVHMPAGLYFCLPAVQLYECSSAFPQLQVT